MQKKHQNNFFPLAYTATNMLVINSLERAFFQQIFLYISKL